MCLKQKMGKVIFCRFIALYALDNKPKLHGFCFSKNCLLNYDKLKPLIAMKKLNFKRFTLTALLSIVMLTSGIAQENITQILKGGLDDAEKLGYAYLEPFGNMFGTALNGGWYQAARPHKLLGFNLTLTASAAMAPVSAKTFDVSSLQLSTIQLKDPQDNLAPTISGEMSAGPTVVVGEGAQSVEFNLPQGAGLPLVPVPFVQASIGLPFSSEVSMRMLPPVDLGKYGRLNLWGIGVKNQFKDFIPGLKEIPLDLSIMVGYTNFSYEYDISYVPGPSDMPTGYTQADFANQKLFLNASGFTGRLLVGKTIPLLSVYAGFGYSHAVTSLGLAGKYAVGVETPYSADDIYTDPLLFDFPKNSFSANVGARIRLGVISIHADYTLGEYALYSGGLGISFR